MDIWKRARPHTETRTVNRACAHSSTPFLSRALSLSLSHSHTLARASPSHLSSSVQTNAHTRTHTRTHTHTCTYSCILYFFMHRSLYKRSWIMMPAFVTAEYWPLLRLHLWRAVNRVFLILIFQIYFVNWFPVTSEHRETAETQSLRSMLLEHVLCSLSR